jgi:hypothetical protein
MNFSRVSKDNRLMKAMTGLSKDEFEALIPSFKEAFHTEQVLRRPNRKRKMGAGQKGTMKTIEEKLLCVLIYLKCYPTYDFLSVLVGGERTRACRNIQFLLRSLERALGKNLVLPERKIRNMEEFLEAFPEAKDLFVDGTERPVQKPKNAKKRKKLYSGKKKQTTRKTIVVSNEKRKILFLSPTKSGRRHDKRLFDKTGLPHHAPQDVTFWTDTGFQGMQKDHVNTVMPEKATKNHPLNEEQKQNNRIISGIRILSEHAIGGIKRMKATADIYRNKLSNMDDTFTLLSAGLWNFHLEQTT